MISKLEKSIRKIFHPKKIEREMDTISLFLELQKFNPLLIS